MNLMLFAIFAAIGVGLAGPRLARRETQLVVLIAVLLTALYFFRPSFIT